MKKETTFISMAFLFASLVFFQNCAEKGSDVTARSSALGYSDNYAPNELIIKMKTKSSYDDMAEWVNDTHSKVEYEWHDEHMALVSWGSQVSVENMMYTMNHAYYAKNIEYIEPNYLLAPPIDFLDNPISIQQSGGDVSASSFNREDLSGFSLSIKNQAINSLTGASQLQGTANISRPVVVAVIDSGLDINHSYFQASEALWVNSGEIPGDNIDNDNNGRVDDVHGWNFINENSNMSDQDGHGTHCAGIVLNISNNIFTDNPSVSPVKVMGLKFIGSNGGKTSDAIKAIDYAVRNGADVISNSWGGTARSQALMSSLVNASNKGVFIAVAAGNDSTNNDARPVYPANNVAPNLISVAASTSDDALASFTNFGRLSVDIAAPGVQVLSTYPREDGEDKFRFLSGTSMATPYVAGTAAIMLNTNPDLTGFEVKNIIVSTANPVSQFQGFLSTASRINSKAANNMARSTASTSEQPQALGGAFAGDNIGAKSVDSAGCGLVLPNDTNKPGGNFPLYILILALPIILIKGLKVNSTLA